MDMSVEARALRRSNTVFKRGVDPDNLVTVLYSSELLTPEEKGKATQRTLTDDQKLEEMFTTMERRVATKPENFHALLQALRDEPALTAVADQMQKIYEEELAKGASSASDGEQKKQSTAGAESQDSDRGTRCPTQKELMDNVRPAGKWYQFALSLLKDDEETVNMIESDTSLPRIQDKLKEVFRIWLDSEDNPTWEAVVTALQDVNSNRPAKKIKDKFC